MADFFFYETDFYVGQNVIEVIIEKDILINIPIIPMITDLTDPFQFTDMFMAYRKKEFSEIVQKMHPNAYGC